jgi:hypothetical protein
MKKRALTRGLTLLLALTLLFVFALSATAAATNPPSVRGEQNCGDKNGPKDKDCHGDKDGPRDKDGRDCHKDLFWKCRHKIPFTGTDACYLIIRKRVTDDSDIGKAFRFTYSIDGGPKVQVTLAAQKIFTEATTFKMTYKAGTKFEVNELYSGDYDTSVNGIPGTYYSGTIKAGNNIVEFVNSPPAYEYEEEVPALG